MLVSHILCTKEGEVYTQWSPNPQCNREEETKIRNIVLNWIPELISPLKVHFPVVAFYIWKSKRVNEKKIQNDQSGLVHWVDDGLRLRQLRRHYVSTWISPGMESKYVLRRQQQDMDVSSTCPIKNPLSLFLLTNNYGQTFARYPESRQYDKSSGWEVLPDV